MCMGSVLDKKFKKKLFKNYKSCQCTRNIEFSYIATYNYTYSSLM